MEKDAEAYRPLLAKRDTEFSQPSPSINLDSPEILPLKQQRRLKALHLWSWIAQILVFGAALTMFTLTLQMQNTPDKRCVDKLSAPSPALESISDDYKWYRFNGTVNEESKFKGPPTPARLKAWDDLTYERAFSVDHATLMRIGAPESAVKLPEEVGGGYMGAVEMFHQIHCVQALWMNTWPEFYHEDAGDAKAVHRMHLDHCADLLRQKLMCDGDVGVVTMQWVKDMSHPTPNFNTLHKCRRWEDIQEWALANEVGQLKDGKIHEPDDAIELEDLP